MLFSRSIWSKTEGILIPLRCLSSPRCVVFVLSPQNGRASGTLYLLSQNRQRRLRGYILRISIVDCRISCVGWSPRRDKDFVIVSEICEIRRNGKVTFSGLESSPTLAAINRLWLTSTRQRSRLTGGRAVQSRPRRLRLSLPGAARLWLTQLASGNIA